MSGGCKRRMRGEEREHEAIKTKHIHRKNKWRRMRGDKKKRQEETKIPGKTHNGIMMRDNNKKKKKRREELKRRRFLEGQKSLSRVMFVFCHS